MAKFKMNKMVDGATGKVGNMVFKTVGSTILYTSSPEHSGEVSEKQVQQRERFKRAAKYAKQVLDNADTKAAYKESVNGQDFKSAFSAAVADYLKSPFVESLNNTGYTGKVNEKISMRVFDDFKVDVVNVSIRQADGTVVEAGVAILNPDSNAWEYVTTQANNVLAGSRISVVVTDKPGNITTFFKTV